MNYKEIKIIEEFPPGVTRDMMSRYVSRVWIKGLLIPDLKERFGKDAPKAFSMMKEVAREMKASKKY